MAMPRVARAFEEYAEDVPGLKAAIPRVAHGRFHASARSARDCVPLPWQCKGHIR